MNLIRLLTAAALAGFRNDWIFIATIWAIGLTLFFTYIWP